MRFSCITWIKWGWWC